MGTRYQIVVSLTLAPMGGELRFRTEGRNLSVSIRDFSSLRCAAGGTTHVIATLLAGAEVDADTFAPGISDFKRMCQRGETQALRIEQWAKAVGVWIDGIDDSLSPCPQSAQSPGLTKRTQPRGIRKKQSVSNK